MDVLIYALMCIPAVLMTVAGIAISNSKKASTMVSHHHAGNFNIKKYSKSIIPLFVITGILFSLGGVLIVSNLIWVGIALMLIALIIFIVRFISIHKN